MCGRYLIEDEAYADILQILNDLNAAKDRIDMDQNMFKHGEIFPTNIAPVIGSDNVTFIKWGFPHWKNSSVIINARAETALEKNMFKKPLREHRCAVPSSGFYEWSRAGSGSGKSKLKEKYLFRLPGEHMLYMAGIANSFRDAFGDPYTAFTILTTAANDSIASVHDRMPVILAADEVNHWIKDDDFMEYALHRIGPELEQEMAV